MLLVERSLAMAQAVLNLPPCLFDDLTKDFLARFGTAEALSGDDAHVSLLLAAMQSCRRTRSCRSRASSCSGGLA